MNDRIKEILDYPTDTPLKFWLKYWDHRIKELCDLDDYGIQLNSPHFLLSEIISEIEHNDFANKDNRSLFKELLGRILKLDCAFSELYKVETGVALKNWDNSPLVVKTILEKILLSMNEHHYLNQIVDKLQCVLEIEQKLNENIKNEICLYTDLFIQEFVCLGMNIEDVSSLIKEDTVVMAEGCNVIICEDSFYELQRKDFVSEEEYHKAVSVRYKSRSAKEYISNILTHFHKEAKDGYVILRLLGVKGSISYHFHDVHLYSIDKAAYLPKDSLNEIEKPDSSQYVNIAVTVKHRFLNTSINYARQRVESLLDYLSFNIRSKDKLSVSKQFAAIVVDDQVCGSHHSVEDDVDHMRQYRDLMAFDLTPYGDDINDWLKEFTENSDISNNTFKKISKSTHWYRKAKCATKFEDKLLYSWVALESILKVSNSIRININPKDSSIINVAKEICSSVMARNRFYSYANNIYTHLVMTTQQFNNYYGFTSKTIESAKLNIQPGDKIELSKFFVELPRLIAEINDEIFKRELIALQSFYEDKKCIIDFKSLVSDDVTLIYRLRNMIVHNAVCPEFIIKLYAYKAQFISGSLIQAVRYHYNKHGMDIGNTLLKIYSEYQILESNISSEIKRLKGV
ncbi:MAG: hypothetical protein IJE43_24005 [Alphaproteobacteria bacterium]|nr:hypothetical protein [Alphaproteobacteria bacterium]MBR3615065.1 hypothetical protein [Bacteroidaceae bacterium]